MDECALLPELIDLIALALRDIGDAVSLATLGRLAQTCRARKAAWKRARDAIAGAMTVCRTIGVDNDISTREWLPNGVLHGIEKQISPRVNIITQWRFGKFVHRVKICMRPSRLLFRAVDHSGAKTLIIARVHMEQARVGDIRAFVSSPTRSGPRASIEVRTKGDDFTAKLTLGGHQVTEICDSDIISAYVAEVMTDPAKYASYLRNDFVVGHA